MRRLAVALATAGGAGRFPVAPGTVGSAIGVAIYLATSHWALGAQFALLAAVSGIGVWASTEAERHFGREDPAPVIIDEVAGQMLSLVATGAMGLHALVGFALFRLFDITKPWPVRQCEAWHGGVGIMADDLMAGLYANIVLHGVVRYFPGGG
jgi:phosphatidylglycerophosphatase A